jgi:hypothetical protein
MDKLEELAAELEPLVDRYGMADVLESLAVLSTLKEEHVSTNWGDRTLARAWKRVGSKIQQAAHTGGCPGSC